MNDSLEEGRGDVQQVNVSRRGHFFLSRQNSSGYKLTGNDSVDARRFATQRISRGAP
jgi:hypothetical protein